jgi:hypothetical protein
MPIISVDISSAAATFLFVAGLGRQILGYRRRRATLANKLADQNNSKGDSS